MTHIKGCPVGSRQRPADDVKRLVGRRNVEGSFLSAQVHLIASVNVGALAIVDVRNLVMVSRLANIDKFWVVARCVRTNGCNKK